MESQGKVTTMEPRLGAHQTQGNGPGHKGPDPQPNTHDYPEFLRNCEVWYKAVRCFTLVNRWPSDCLSVETKYVKDTKTNELCRPTADCVYECSLYPSLIWWDLI